MASGPSGKKSVGFLPSTSSCDRRAQRVSSGREWVGGWGEGRGGCLVKGLGIQQWKGMKGCEDGFAGVVCV